MGNTSSYSIEPVPTSAAQSAVQEPLSPRQAEIARMVARGHSSRAIAEALCVSRRTVENHLAAIYDKLGIASRAELIVAERGAVARVTRTNLPLQRTVFVGRATERAQILGLFESNRLVTVTGAGGLGKTRTALAVGESLSNAGTAVWLVELGALGKGSSVEAAVARALDMRESPGVPFIDTLIARLRTNRLLLILDNCEHLIADVAAAARALLDGCPELRILATSREPLRVAGEVSYRLPPLSVPAAAECERLRANRSLEFEAVVLFAERARHSHREFILNDENAPVVADICRRLDGMPLALELAAARVRVLTVRSILAKLDRRFRILTNGDRTALPRHQTMRALFDWSYDLLEPAEQRLFERVSMFAGGWDLAAATAICDDERDEIAVLAVLSSLVDKSLVIVDLTQPEPRYALLESARHYAAEKLAARGETALLARRHARHYLEVAERFEREYGRYSDADTERTISELDNWRTALNSCLVARGDIELGQRLAAALGAVWGVVSLTEGRRWCDLATASVDERTPGRVAMHLEFAATGIVSKLGQWESALSKSLRLLSADGRLFEPQELAQLEAWAGESLVCLGRITEAEPFLQGALTKGRLLGQRRVVGRALENLAYARSAADNPAEARVYVAEAIDSWNSIGAEKRAIAATVVLAEAEFRAGKAELAVELATAAVGRLRERGAEIGMDVSINRAAYCIACDRWDAARAACCEALALPQEAHRTTYLAWALQHVAAITILSARAKETTEDVRIAAQLLGYVDAYIATLGSPREYTEQQEYDRTRAALLHAVSATEEKRLFEAGARFSAQQAMACALEQLRTN